MWVLSVVGFALVNIAIARHHNHHHAGENGGETETTYTINGGGDGGETTYSMNGGGGGGGSTGGQEGGSITLTNKFSISQRNQVIEDLQNKNPRVTIKKDMDGNEVLNLPTEVLYDYLTKDQGLQLPPISKIPGFTSDKPHTHKLITIYPNQLFIVLSNKDKFANANPAILSTVLRTPNAGNPVIPGTNGLTLTITLSPEQQKHIIKSLGKLSGVSIDTNEGTVKISVKALLKFLKQQGLEVPSLSDLGLSEKKGKIDLHLSLDTILSIISHKDTAKEGDISAILKLIIKNKGSVGVKGGVEIRGNGKLGGNCKGGLVQKATGLTGGAANGALGGAKDIVQGVANKVPVVGGAVSKLEGIKSDALTGLVNAAKKTIDDAGCGVGGIADKLVAGLATGDILGGLKNGISDLTKGAGKVLDDAAGGVGNTLKNALGGLTGGDHKGGLFGSGGIGIGI